MKKYIVTLCMLLLSVATYSQSKLIRAGKAAKAGTVTSATTKTVSRKVTMTDPKTSAAPKSSTSPKSSGTSRKVTATPFKILSIKLLNTDYDQGIIDKDGSKFYSADLQYLVPAIAYNGLVSSKRDYTLYVKIFTEDGTLIRIDDGSPEIYSYSTPFEVKPGTNKTSMLAGIGSRDGGFFAPGLYTFEIWHGGKRQISRQIRIYTGSAPVMSNGLMDISNMTFCNQDEKGNVLSNNLYDGEVQYVTPTITYRGLNTSSQNAKFYYRFFRADGTLVQGKNSPEGFSTTCETAVKPGNNTLTLSGYGSSSTTVYTEGTHKFELWLDGEKIYEKKFDVVKKGSSSNPQVDASSSLATLKFLLENPLGVTSCNVFTAQHSTFLDAFRSMYKINQSNSDPTHYYATNSDNFSQFYKLGFCGVPMHRLDFFLRNDRTRLVYTWEPKMSDFPDKYAILNALVADLNKVGIQIDYNKTGEKYDIAKGAIVFAGKTYTVNLTDYGSVYQVELVIDTLI